MGSDINQHVLATDPADKDEWRRMAVNVAGGIAFHHPHELDDENPKAAGRELAKNPLIAAGLRELLDYIGYQGQQEAS